MPTVSLKITGNNSENVHFVLLKQGGVTKFRWLGTNGNPLTASVTVPSGNYKVVYEASEGTKTFENDQDINISSSGTITVEENRDDYSITFG